MYEVYQVILVAEDGEYVKSEWQTESRAIDEAEKIKGDYGEGQYIAVRAMNRGF